MLREFIASLRLAFALVCVGVSLILGGQWLGLIPDMDAMEMRTRQRYCEAIAINASAHVRRQQWVDLTTILKTQVERNDEILSIGLRSDLGTLRLDTGHHQEMWSDLTQHESGEEARLVEAISVPITLNRRPWGSVEFCFRKPASSAWAPFTRHAVFRLIGFFVIAGLASYTLFVAKIMGVFRKTQVVPDRVRQALDTLAEGLLVLDEQGKIVLANRAFTDTIGIPLEELVKKSASGLSWTLPHNQELSPSDDATYPWTAAIAKTELQSERMLHYRLADGRNRIFSVNAAPLGSDDQQRGALATFRDVTHVEEHREELEKMLGMLRSSRDEIERKNSELEILATQDALTGCLNRRAFFERFDAFWRTAQTNNTPLSCVMIDNDHFKNVNDTYGHHIGDEVLRRVSQIIRDMHQDHGLVCRYGGEEFCVVFPDLTLKQALDEAEKTRAAIAAIQFEEPAELKLTASLGVSELRFNPADPQELINQADACLYVAKREGRNRVIAYNVNMADQAEQDQNTVAKPQRLDISYQAVTALMSALSYRDAKTAEHSRRVADLCSRASAQILDPAQIYVLEIAALLHDIGKVGVPDNVLLKPGMLTEQEWEVMRRHDRIGVEIVSSTFSCDELTSIIAAHQWIRLEGQRSGSVPPLNADENGQVMWCAKMLTIADSYDAMISDTVYRQGCSHDDAIAELRRCAGTQFDPELVEHFTRAIDETALAVTLGAFAVGKQAAIQIGINVERLAEALTQKDLKALQEHAAQLAVTANHCGLESVTAAANQICEITYSENLQWAMLLRDTNELLDTARSAQADFLRDALELENSLSFESS
ncbi:Response regulator PleD [Novipirellula galeiformis]|uniref:diguanylate cyclase n=1 Tax=Novipirellula galeiformis TaxID=2528004 RepID=A0A5C6CH44_9BACT|nr:diguanylate cyclase [Novipirellula galeiformis]TWU24223.1 Response regulator PleD [Novipirellula galeiformis]